MITLSLLLSKSDRKYGNFLKWKTRSAFHPLSVESFFPLEIKADKGSANDDFKKRESELKPLIQKSKANCAHGYTLVFEEVKTRANGTQSRLSKILFESEKDFLSFIGKEKECENAMKALEILKNDLLHFSKADEESFLEDWAIHNLPSLTGEHANEKDFWKNIALCVNWLSENRESNLYIREIPLPVHTKFIETNKSLILSLIFPTDTPAASQFEFSLALKQKPPRRL